MSRYVYPAVFHRKKVGIQYFSRIWTDAIPVETVFRMPL